jgi:uncharacterized SAM-binding protein YcdF (DUF218 family)
MKQIHGSGEPCHRKRRRECTLRRFLFASAGFVCRDRLVFWFKKLISGLLMPLPLVLLCGGIGLVLLRSGRGRRSGRALVACSILLLLSASNRWVSGRLIDPLESRYPAIGEFAPGAPLPPALAACRCVVVLGGGHDERDDLPTLSRLSTSSRARLTEGVRIWRLLPDAQLVVSGPVDGGGPSHARVQAAAAVSLGVDRHRIRIIEEVHDTADEAARLRDLLGDTPFALVTSAWHMPRAMALCAAHDLHPVPCPTDYLAGSPSRHRLSDYGWDTSSLERTRAAVHEYLGWCWARLCGRG